MSGGSGGNPLIEFAVVLKQFLLGHFLELFEVGVYVHLRQLAIHLVGYELGSPDEILAVFVHRRFKQRGCNLLGWGWYSRKEDGSVFGNPSGACKVLGGFSYRPRRISAVFVIAWISIFSAELGIFR